MAAVLACKGWQGARNMRGWFMAGLSVFAALLGSPALGSPTLTTAIEGRLPAAGASSNTTDAELAIFYRSRAYHPLWQDETQVAALVTAIDGLKNDGLTPADYLSSDTVERVGSLNDDDHTRVTFELELTQGFLTAMRHLARGKSDPRRLEEDWSIPLASYTPDWARLSHQLDNGEVEGALDTARPQAEFYRALREGLAHYRAVAAAGGWPRLPERGESLRQGDRHPDIALLRQRLAIEYDPANLPADGGYYQYIDTNAQHIDTNAQDTDPAHFDSDLAAQVRDFQRRHLLEADGIVGRATLRALNLPVSSRIDQIRVNLERARWLLHDLPDAYVLVDIAGYELHHIRPGGDSWRTRIVVGQPYRKTPSIRSSITHLTFNPTWTIPPTIFREDKLPRIREDLAYLEEQNLRVLSPSGEELDPAEVDWDRPGGVMLRQAAGAGNPLGDLVIRFPNDHAIYLHDTPAQGLFNRVQRAASAGCIRVQHIHELARQLFDDSQRWRAADIASRIAEQRTGNVSLSHRVPVILSYWTASPSEEGGMAFRPDIYARDSAVRRALDES